MGHGEWILRQTQFTRILVHFVVIQAPERFVRGKNHFSTVILEQSSETGYKEFYALVVCKQYSNFFAATSVSMFHM